ncbi:MAG: flagellar basal-body rod protein FlgG [Phycisphaerae bacterium]
MAITALNSAATGLNALSTKIDVIANNLANAETTAFKRSRANFEELLYLVKKQPGVTNADGEVSPAGIFVGLGVRVANTQLISEQGSLEPTDRDLDVGIQGNGFFRVRVLDSVGEGVAYTRNGNFFVNNEGQLVLGLGDGYRVDPPIDIPPEATEVSISRDGEVAVIIPGQNAAQIVGAFELNTFINPAGLKLQGGGLYTETESSGPALTGRPGEDGLGVLLQGSLEASNVDPVKELVTLIKTQRSFELNSQSIQTADQALQTISNLRRF